MPTETKSQKVPRDQRTIKIGRIVQVNYGDNSGVLAAVVDVVDMSRVLIDGPSIARQTIPVRQVSLTPIEIKVGKGARTGTVARKFTSENVQAQFDATPWAKKAAKAAKRSNLTDFERFKVLTLQKKKALVLGKALNKLKSAK